MALKAGRVGVNPSQVDMAGNVIGAGGDTYTKLEIDQMMGSKVGIGQLEANNKDFYFAYDETTQKYGYKLDNTGDFHPFESAPNDVIFAFPEITVKAEDMTKKTSKVFTVSEDSGLYIDTVNKVCYFNLRLTTSDGVVLTNMDSIYDIKAEIEAAIGTTVTLSSYYTMYYPNTIAMQIGSSRYVYGMGSTSGVNTLFGYFLYT